MKNFHKVMLKMWISMTQTQMKYSLDQKFNLGKERSIPSITIFPMFCCKYVEVWYKKYLVMAVL